MDIIQSWVDENEVREYASLLMTPQKAAESQPEEDFIVVSPEEIFVKQGISKLNKEIDPQLADQATSVEESVQALTAEAPVLGEPRAKQKAIEALQQAAVQSNQTQAQRVSKRTNEQGGQQGWDQHRHASAELKEHLGDSAGALVNPEAVTSSLDAITQELYSSWGCSQICISDRDGDMFVDTMKNPAWSKLTVSVTEPIRLLDIKQETIGHGYMHLKLTAKEFLQVVVSSTSHGLIILGMVREKQMNADEVKQLVTKVRSLV